MPGQITIDAMTKWENDINVPLSEVLRVSMDTMERTGEEACKHAIILMAQSMASGNDPLTRKSAKRRDVLENNAGAKYVEVWQQGQNKPGRLYKFQFETDDPKWKRAGTWANAQKVGNSGLARKSWMWGLARLGKAGNARPMAGMSRLYAIQGENAGGYILENRLPYILKAVEPGWETTVVQRAGNKIMGQARARLERTWPPVAEAAGARMAA